MNSCYYWCMNTKKRTGRPKGSLQKNRNNDKYWLPEGVILAPGAPDIYHKTTKLLFIDVIYGEFISDFHSLQCANASTHKAAVAARRAATNRERYGCDNPGANPEVKQKRQDTTEKKYGVRHALQSEIFMEKVRQTSMVKCGLPYPTLDPEVRKKMAKTNIERYGSENVAKNPEVIKKGKKTSLERYGHDNPSKAPIVKERILKSFEKRGFQSKGERELNEYIQSLGFETKTGSYFGGADPMQADIKIPSLKIAFEYNGEYWHTENRVGKDYHLRKFNAAKNNGYKLIQIFEYEWYVLNFQVKSFIRSALGKNDRIINGRDTDVREVQLKEAKKFLNDFHILGSPRVIKRAYGLYYKDELVALATMNKHHRNNKEDVLTRFCGKYNVTVRGGLDKLCSAISGDYEEFFTFIDLRMSNGRGWLTNGWSLVYQSEPDYFYFDSTNYCHIKKQSMSRHSTDRPLDITESQDAINRGYSKIFDCGKLKLKYTGIKSK